MKKEMATKKKIPEICTYLGIENGFLNITLKSETIKKKMGEDGDCIKVTSSCSKNYYKQKKKVNDR